MAWVHGLIKVEGSASAFKRGYLDWGRECFMEVNIGNWTESLSDTYVYPYLCTSVCPYIHKFVHRQDTEHYDIQHNDT